MALSHGIRLFSIIVHWLIQYNGWFHHSRYNVRILLLSLFCCNFSLSPIAMLCHSFCLHLIHDFFYSLKNISLALMACFSTAWHVRIERSEKEKQKNAELFARTCTLHCTHCTRAMDCICFRFVLNKTLSVKRVNMKLRERRRQQKKKYSQNKTAKTIIVVTSNVSWKCFRSFFFAVRFVSRVFRFVHCMHIVSIRIEMVCVYCVYHVCFYTRIT